MATQKHPEISITLRRLSDDDISINIAAHTSDDVVLSAVAQELAREIAAELPHINKRLNDQAEAQTAEEQIH